MRLPAASSTRSPGPSKSTARRSRVGVSIGIALAPENGLAREDLMRLADTALYQAKSEGRNRFRFFARAMDETIRMRKTVEDDLRSAIHQRRALPSTTSRSSRPTARRSSASRRWCAGRTPSRG